MGEKKKVVVADLQPVAAEGLRALTETAGDLEFAGGVQTAPAAIEVMERTRAAVLVVDKSFGPQTVISMIADIKAVSSDCAVVVWGATVSEAEVLRFAQAGAKGIIRKSESLEELLTCLRTVASGGIWMTGETGGEGQLASSNARLTAREKQVVDLVLQGMRNREIAAELGMRPGTVKVHLKHIFEKTGIRGRYGLALSCLRKGKAAGAGS